MEIVSDFYDKQEIVEAIRSSIEKQKLVPIIGAGFTSSCVTKAGKAVPDGQSFKEAMAKIICHQDPKYKFEELTRKEQDLDTVSAIFFKVAPQQDKSKLLTDSFIGVRLDDGRRNFLDINWPYIYTLNIDNAIETNSDFSAIKPHKELDPQIKENIKCVFKLHGDVVDELGYINRGERPNLIFTRSQYLKSLKSNESLLNFFQSDYYSNSIMFVGCSLDNEVDIEAMVVNSEMNIGDGVNRYYVTRRYPDQIRQFKLEELGITHVLLIDDYPNFYGFMVDIASRAQPYNSIFQEHKNLNISRLDCGDKEGNRKFLANLYVRNDLRLVQPYYSYDRAILPKVMSLIKYPGVVVIAGSRFSGKTIFAKQLVSSITSRDTYFFASEDSLNDKSISDLCSLTSPSTFIFDAGSIDVNNLINIFKKLYDKDSKHSAVVLVDKSDNLICSIAAKQLSRYEDRYMELSSFFSEDELSKVNERANKGGLLTFKANVKLINNCYDHFEIYRKRYEIDFPVKAELLERAGFKISLVLACDHKIHSDAIVAMGISQNDLANYMSIMHTIVEKRSTDLVEVYRHSGYKLILNSTAWLFQTLSKYKNKYVGNRAEHTKHLDEMCDDICAVVKSLKGNHKKGISREFSSIYKRLVLFDNLNQCFSGGRQHAQQSGGDLIPRLYRSLEPILYDDLHFWLQRGKSVLYRQRKDVDALRDAILYVQKPYRQADADNKLRVNAMTTLAQLHGRVANLMRYTPKHLDEALYWYYMAFQQETNKQYMDTILERRNRSESDLSCLTKFIMENPAIIGRDRQRKKYAEYLVNRFYHG